TYLLLEPGTDPKALEGKLPEFLEKFLPGENGMYEYSLQSLRDIHLHSAGINTQGCETIDVIYVYIFPLIAFFILLIACINYMNLATARSAGRAREVGLRKTIGANRFQLVRQFLAESAFQAMLALVIAVSLVELALPAFNAIFGTSLALIYPGNWFFLACFVALTLWVGLLAGGYPAFFLSSFQPLAILKGLIHRGSTGLALRRILVVIQFGISIVLIISTLMISRQLNYLLNKDMGFNKEQVLCVPMPGGVGRDFEALRQELLRNPVVTGITASSEQLGVGPWQQAVDFEGKDPGVKWMFNIKVVDPDYLTFYGLDLVDGRGFSREFSADSALNAYVINESLARKIGWDSPVGKRFKVWSATHQGTVVGVVKDFNFVTLKKSLEPLALTLLPKTRLSAVSIRIRPENTAATLKYIEDTLNRFRPDLPFEYSFLDEEFGRLYKTETLLGWLSGVFSLFAVFIACLGLLGLISFAAERRTKEIGIRKVLGASVAQIVFLLSKEFLLLLGIAALIAWPVAWYAMDRWLSNFAYRINLDWFTFVLAGLLALVIAAVTVSFQALRAATANPVDALRYE
ncbi:MAG: FtsX-like permease family protein, partial [Candidatus Glassbacteria bacterium]|nr:FtsX-like permease family protein [Candidatus Glassbacteria bacterium]